MTSIAPPATAPELAPEVVLGGPVAADRRQAARATLGLSGGADRAEPLRPMLRQAGVSFYPVIALGVLGFVDVFQSQALVVLTPDVSSTLGLSLGVIGAARALQFLAQVAAPVPMSALARKLTGKRAVLCLTTALVWSAVTLLTGFVTSLLALLAVLFLDGLSTGSVLALHSPMIADSYPPGARIRVLAGYTSVAAAGYLGAPLLVAVMSGPMHLTWRGDFLGLGLVSLAGSMLALRLRDPRPGQFDTEALHADIAAQDHSSPTEASDTDLGFFEIFRRLLLIPTLQRLCVGFLVFGMLTIPYSTFLSTFLLQKWHLAAPGRGLVIAAGYAIAITGLVIYGRVGENDFAKNPANVVGRIGLVVMLAVVCIAIGALSPFFIGMVVFFGLGTMFIGITLPGLNGIVLSIVDARQRSQAAALVGLFLASGSILGLLLLSGVDTEYGVTGSIVSLVIPGLLGGLILRSARQFVDQDIDRMVDGIIEEEDLTAFKRQGGRPPMLTAKGINFYYGQLQVLFDVDFTVDEGEMVALLGTNGAGKSTLLKAISGIGLPQAGTIRLAGNDITYLDAERRVRLGITQIPGGHSVFSRLSVVENLKGFGYTLGSDKKRIDEAIERCLTAFPRLDERRTSLGATLSGGEQQMLGLCKALILQPKLLLIDELSLGLAPVIVAQLLDMVRAINAEGTAVVLVEQSVNIALSLVNHAYFMEKGEMRFDGAAADLLGRDDLLRAVFLEGATKGRQAVRRTAQKKVAP
jgi:ABC-type branched-subunit amino acid transport system ATPase component/sugar phosphate permease